MKTHAEIKRLVIGDRKPGKYQNIRLFVSEHDGELYATNSYWLVPVRMVEPLLTHNNLPTDKPEVYEVSSKLSVQDMEPPNVSAIMPTLTDKDNIHRSLLNGSGASLFIRPGNVWLALFDRVNEDGAVTQVAFDASFVSFIDNDDDLRGFATGYGTRLDGEPIYRQAKPDNPMGVYAKRQKNSTTAQHEWTDDGEQFLGLVMPVRIG